LFTSKLSFFLSLYRRILSAAVMARSPNAGRWGGLLPSVLDKLQRRQRYRWEPADVNPSFAIELLHWGQFIRLSNSTFVGIL
jgi:hypothetical protein